MLPAREARSSGMASRASIDASEGECPPRQLHSIGYRSRSITLEPPSAGTRSPLRSARLCDLDAARLAALSRLYRSVAHQRALAGLHVHQAGNGRHDAGMEEPSLQPVHPRNVESPLGGRFEPLESRLRPFAPPVGSRAGARRRAAASNPAASCRSGVAVESSRRCRRITWRPFFAGAPTSHVNRAPRRASLLARAAVQPPRHVH